MIANPIPHALDPGHDPPRPELARRNDALRIDGVGGVLVVTVGVIALGAYALPQVLAAVRAYDRFTAASDPHGDHRAGVVEWHGTRVLWRIDDCDLKHRSSDRDPANPPASTRVLTITLPDEG